MALSATITHGGNVEAAARARGIRAADVLDFSASINPLGFPPGVRVAIVDAIDRVQRYPEPYADTLRDVLAQHWDVDPARVLLGNGATDLIHFVARCLPGLRVNLAVPTFSEFHRAWPEAALISAKEPWPDEGFLALTNPVNPTGQVIDVPVHRSGPTLVDESFLDFTDLPSCSRATFRLRSLTKFYALPGLRIGALIGPADLMEQWRLRREPWQVNVLAQAALLAALEDENHAAATKRFVRLESAWLLNSLRELPGVTPISPAANYVFCHVEGSASALARRLLARNILIRVCTGWPGIDGDGVRVAVRTREENESLIAAWKECGCV